MSEPRTHRYKGENLAVCGAEVPDPCPECHKTPGDSNTCIEKVKCAGEELDATQLGIAIDEAAEDSAWNFNSECYIVSFRIPQGETPTTSMGQQILALLHPLECLLPDCAHSRLPE